MTPGSFDPTTAREIVGDALARQIESAARTDAEAGRYAPPDCDGDTYWDRVQAEMRAVVYREQHQRRLARLARKSTPQ